MLALGLVASVGAHLAGQSLTAPATPTSVRILSELDPPAFQGTTVYVSLSGSDANAGTQSSPVRTIQRGVTLANQLVASNTNARVLIAAGTYREAVDLGSQPNTNAVLVLEGAGASTVLSGADDWSTGWTQQADGSYLRAWPYKWGMQAVPPSWDYYWNSSGMISHPDKDTLRRTEMVYVNGAPLAPKLSLTAMNGAGQFYVDETNGRLHMRLPAGASLPGALVDVSTRVQLLRIVGRRNVTLRNFAVMRSRGAIQDMMVAIVSGSNITLDGIFVTHAAYTGIGANHTTGLTIRNSTLNDNGVNSYSDYRNQNLTIEGSEVARNNWRGWAIGHRGWDSVFKLFNIRTALVRRTRFVDNFGNGFWVDADNTNVTVEKSLMSGNRGRGISLEANQGPIVISGSVICNNHDVGVSDAQSDRVTLRDNTVFGNRNWNLLFTGHYNGRTFTNWQTGESYTAKSLYWTVTGNTFVGSGTGTGTTDGGWLSWHTDWQASGAWAAIRGSFVAFDNNRWVHTQKTAPFTMPGGAKTYAQFKADLQLANPAFEANSTFSQQAPSLSCTLPD